MALHLARTSHARIAKGESVASRNATCDGAEHGDEWRPGHSLTLRGGYIVAHRKTHLRNRTRLLLIIEPLFFSLSGW